MSKRHRYRPGLRRRREARYRAEIASDPVAQLVEWQNNGGLERFARTVTLGFQRINEFCNEMLAARLRLQTPA
jgi:hypothetical protein